MFFIFCRLQYYSARNHVVSRKSLWLPLLLLIPKVYVLSLGPFKSIIQTSIIRCHSFDTISHILLIGDYIFTVLAEFLHQCKTDVHVSHRPLSQLPSFWARRIFIDNLNNQVRVAFLSQTFHMKVSSIWQRTLFQDENPEGLTLNEKGCKRPLISSFLFLSS